MTKTTRPQLYPRIEDESNKFHGYLDEQHLNPHRQKITPETLRQIIIQAIENANKKSSRSILEIPNGLTDKALSKLYRKKGNDLFKYFVRYCGDPAATAHQCIGRHYSDVAKEQFRNRTLQKERMNSGWRYQFIVKNAASASGRFESVSDIGSLEADFNVVIAQRDRNKGTISIYASIKNRMNTMGGQDWPKAIHALEEVAKNDKNRTGTYLCVFGIAMENGQRIIRTEQKTKQPYSNNTEVWLSDFLWPFFSNYSYAEIVNAVISVLIDTQKPDAFSVDIPGELVEAFGDACRENGLLDHADKFSNAHKLGQLFVNGVKGLSANWRK
jgi:hypothetical protein